MTCIRLVYSVLLNMILILRGLDGCGNYRLYLPPLNEELSIEIKENVQIIKLKYLNFFFTECLWPRISCLKFKADLMVDLLIIQSPFMSIWCCFLEIKMMFSDWQVGCPMRAPCPVGWDIPVRHASVTSPAQSPDVLPSNPASHFLSIPRSVIEVPHINYP